MNENNYKDIKRILEISGSILADKFNQVITYNEKERYDLVSETDLEIENILIKELKVISPDFSIFSEECGNIDNNSGYKWIIDPIDGTANFIFGVPYFNISIALEYKNQIIEGYVYNPVTKEFYYSTEKLGISFLNDKEINVSKTKKIEEALVVFGFSANFKNIEKYHDKWKYIFDNSKKGLGLLSPALNICNVARGRIDCFIDFGTSMEGHAAGSLILKNAGGVVKNYDLGDWDHRVKGIAASNKNIYKGINDKD
jgi:myo-inositol-1(or 4)-monophosphatase